LWHWAKGKLKTEEIKNRLLLGTDKNGKPPGTEQQSAAMQRFYKKHGSGLKRI